MKVSNFSVFDHVDIKNFLALLQSKSSLKFLLHYALKHLDTTSNNTRILFVDQSSAFNTILLSILEHQHSLLQVPDSTR